MKRKHLLLIGMTLTSLLLSGCKDADGNPISPFKTEDFTGRISFNVWDFLAVFLAFIVLLLVVFYFGYKPIKKAIQARKDYVEGNIKTAEEREEKSRGLVEEANQKLAKSKKEAFEIVEKAKVDANKEKEQIIEEAKLEAKEEKQKAREEIAQEIEANKEQIRKEIVDVALTASSELLGREVNDKDNKRLLDDFVNDLEKGDK